jgi:probable rRNA maturation factor
MIGVEVEIACRGWLEALPDAEALTREAAQAVPGAGNAAVLLTDDETLAELNARFRDREGPTNVLSFPASPNFADHLGDVALAFGVCQAEAGEQGKPLADHLRHLVAHGLLHLMGYDHEDESEAQVMESLERNILGGMGLPDPYGDAGQDRSHAEP